MTKRGWTVVSGGIVLLALGALTGLGLAVGLGVAALAVIGASAVGARRRWRLTAGIALDAGRVNAGDHASARVTVLNESDERSPAVGATLDLPDRGQPITIPALEPGTRHSVRVPLPTLRRGAWQVGPLRLSHADPLGLIAARGDLGHVQTLIVHPRRVRLSTTLASAHRSVAGPAGALRRLDAMSSTGFRDFSEGDDVRFIHWASSARTGRLLVREEVESRAAATTVVLDERSECWDEIRFETAVSIVASIVETTNARGDEARIQVGSLRVPLAPDDPTAVIAALDRLATIGHVPGATPWWELDRWGSGSLVVVTGTAEGAELDHVHSMSNRLRSVLAVAVVGAGSPPPSSVPSARSRVLVVSSLEEFAVQWPRS